MLCRAAHRSVDSVHIDIKHRRRVTGDIGAPKIVDIVECVYQTSDVVEIIFKNLGKKPSLIPGFWSNLLVFIQTRLMSRHRAIMMQGKFLAKGAGLEIE